MRRERSRALAACSVLLVFGAPLMGAGCADAVAGRERSDGGSHDAGATTIDVGPLPADAPMGIDVGSVLGDDAGTPDVGGPSLPPPLARPPAPPPDHASVIATLAAERPDVIASSCVTMGGNDDFLLESVRRLHAIDARYGLVTRGGEVLRDRVAYFWGDGAPEGRTEIYVLDVIARHCAAPGTPPPGPGWGDDSAAGGTWTTPPLDGRLPDPIEPEVVPLPDLSGVVRDLAAERPDLLAASCVADGGNNEFLFELVRRLRRIDVRFGLNWKRAVVGDMSQDVVDYYYGAGAPYEGAWETHVVDVIGGHCGPTPSPAWIDVTVLGSRNALWTLAGRSDLGP